MDIRQLLYFITVAEEGQITAAAKKLHMAQPPLSQQMKHLEDELGVALFKRGSRQTELTDAGKILFRRAQQIINLSDSTLREIKDFKEGVYGTLSIGMVSSSGSVILRPFMQQFHRQYCGVRFEVYDGNTFKIIDLLTKGLIEIGIVRTPFNYEPFHLSLQISQRRAHGPGLDRRAGLVSPPRYGLPKGTGRQAPHPVPPLRPARPGYVRRPKHDADDLLPQRRRPHEPPVGRGPTPDWAWPSFPNRPSRWRRTRVCT